MQSRGNLRNSSGDREHSFGSRLRTGAAGAIVIGGAIFMGGAASLVTAFAHSGTVLTSENCSTWSASVTLANNVTSDRFVDVVTTIPGTTGITNGHYDTSKGLIWDASGPSPAGGKVTLNIYLNSNNKPGALEFTASSSLVPATGCMSSPTLSTNASDGGAVGTTIHDTATLSGANAPTGNVVFTLYPSLAACNAGTGSVFTHSSPLSANAPFTANSTDFAPASVGTFQWRATYAGDSKNHAASSECGSEPVTISQASSAIVTKQSAGGPVGTVLSDTATVTGSAGSPSGTVIFKLYAPSNATCNADGTAPVFTSAAIGLTSVTPGISNAASGPYTSAAVGQYHWVAAYSGDAKYKSAASGCADEPVTTSQAAPSIATTASSGGTVPVAVSDSATVSGGDSPTGTVVFTLYPDLASCSAGTGAVFTSSAQTLSGGAASSGSFTLTTAGTFQWVAKYSGDTNNVGISSKCGDEPVTSSTGGVLGITTPPTGTSASLTGVTIGGFLLLSGLGVALLGTIVPRRRRTQ
jgi:hypothetical protein